VICHRYTKTGKDLDCGLLSSDSIQCVDAASVFRIEVQRESAYSPKRQKPSCRLHDDIIQMTTNKKKNKRKMGMWWVTKRTEDERKEMRVGICKFGARAISITHSVK
jgi:hypothetical protein